MAELVFTCPSCGADFDMANVDTKKRIGYCIFCRQYRPIPKKHSNNSAEFQANLDEAVNLFKGGNFSSARRCAEAIISMSKKNAVANYIVSFCDAFTETYKDTKKFEDYFLRQFPDFEMEIEEEELLKTLLIATRNRSMEFECEILKKCCEYDDPAELASFVEKFSPACIQKRPDIAFMTEDMMKTYAEISEKCDIPQTWLALYNAMLKNPDSPLSNDSFYLKTKSERVLEEFIKRVGKVFESIKNPAQKEKLCAAYQKVLKVYEAKLAKANS